MNTDRAEAATATRIMRKPEVLSILGVSHMWLDRACRAGRFPKPVHMSPRCVGWLSGEVDDWLKTRAAERGSHAPSGSNLDDLCLDDLEDGQ